jgi:hypothetical protein
MYAYKTTFHLVSFHLEKTNELNFFSSCLPYFLDNFGDGCDGNVCIQNLKKKRNIGCALTSIPFSKFPSFGITLRQVKPLIFPFASSV